MKPFAASSLASSSRERCRTIEQLLDVPQGFLDLRLQNFLKSLKAPLCFYDLETTGLDKNKHHIVEMSMIAVDCQGVLHYWDKTYPTKVDPSAFHYQSRRQLLSVPLETAEQKEALEYTERFHHANKEMLSNCPSFEQIIPSIEAFWQQASTSMEIEPTAKSEQMLYGLLGYNHEAFDNGFIETVYKRLNKTVPKIAYSLDVMRLMKMNVPQWECNCYSLEKGAYPYYCQKNLQNAHEAEVDTLATIEVFFNQILKHRSLPTGFGELCLMTNQKWSLGHWTHHGKHFPNSISFFK